MRLKSLIFFITVSLPLFFLGCPYTPMGGHMGGDWEHMMGYGGYGGYGGIFFWVILIVLVIVVIYLLPGRNKSAGNVIGSPQESAMDILKKRYAKGEISKEEFEQMKSDLEN